jgi:hypothetical protein
MSQGLIPFGSEPIEQPMTIPSHVLNSAVYSGSSTID